jgi:hypothetical protein
MARGRGKANRVQAIEQAAIVWAVIDEDTTEEHLTEFIEGGTLAAAPEALPYNPHVMAQIARNWNQ